MVAGSARVYCHNIPQVIHTARRLSVSAVVCCCFAREALFLRVVRTRSMNNKKAKRREKQTRPHSVMKHHSVIGGKR